MALAIRPAQKEDAKAGVALLYSSGSELVKYIFGDGDEALALRFLRMAWYRGNGQYGCKNHWVATYQNSVAGLISCWHDKLPSNFDAETMGSISDVFSHKAALSVVARSQEYASQLLPPQQNEFAIGHVAVTEEFKRKGIASALMAYMQTKAIELGKEVLVLDVENTNLPAMAFYEHEGFHATMVNQTFTRMVKPLAT